MTTPATSPTRRRRRRSREQTESELLDAALDLLGTTGVLTGVQLREVATKAGINHGQIYTYFGTKRDLLRKALNREVSRHFAGRDHWRLPFRVRRMNNFAWAIEHVATVRIQALLVLDQDDEFRIFPRLSDTFEAIADDKLRGEIDEESDGVAAHVLTSATILGYALCRAKMADELGLGVTELDARVRRQFAEVLDQLASPPRDTEESRD